MVNESEIKKEREGIVMKLYQRPESELFAVRMNEDVIRTSVSVSSGYTSDDSVDRAISDLLL